MSLMEEYNPLKGKRLEILQPDGTLKQGMKAPLDDQDHLHSVSTDALHPAGRSKVSLPSEAGAVRNLCTHLGAGGLPGWKRLSCFKKETGFFLLSARSAPR